MASLAGSLAQAGRVDGAQLPGDQAAVGPTQGRGAVHVLQRLPEQEVAGQEQCGAVGLGRGAGRSGDRLTRRDRAAGKYLKLI